MRIAEAAVTAGLLAVSVGVVGAVGAATRLDRLHVRTDASWAALDAALCHRARVVSALDGAGPSGGGLHGAADAALSAGGTDVPLRAGAHAAREEVENELGRALALLNRAELEPACARWLADAEQRVVIARRVYNDAVRDTLALRSHLTVRWLQLAGRAPLPRYFEIAEPMLQS
ncbi:MAG: NUDIX hydrolase [Pseudonocardiaceae bacterium]